MRRPHLLSTLGLLVGASAVLALLHACQEMPKPTEPPAAAEQDGVSGRPTTTLPSASSAAVGKWDPAFPTPAVAIHLHVLPTGKVLFWGHRGESEVWDPANPGAGFTEAVAPYEQFCSGHSLLPDGRLLVAGGHIDIHYGLRSAGLFNPGSQTWTTTPTPMAQGRWYPTVTALPSGEMLVTSGSDEDGTFVDVPEIWNGSTWRRLTGASLRLPYYPSMFVAPNGKVFYAGYTRTTRYLDIRGSGAWSTVASRRVANRNFGTAVMYAPGKVLYAGGGSPPTASAEVIDLNQPSPSWRTVAGMAFARRNTNGTILPDGEVLVTGGTSGPGNDVNRAMRSAELWNPATESWKTMAAETNIRVYHSTAVLLPDGRVLSSGSGEGGGISYAASQLSAQVFNPPYLFNPDGTRAARPAITSGPSTISYGTTFAVRSPDAGSVRRGSLIRLSSVTHAVNQSQLIFPLAFSRVGVTTTLNASAPANANLAPPGPYMLFLVNQAGVPSVAKMVTVGR